MGNLYDWNDDGEMSQIDEETEFYEYRRTVVEGKGAIRRKDLDLLIDSDVADAALIDEDLDDDDFDDELF